MKRRITLLLMLLAYSFVLQAQNSTQGKEFWFTYMQNGYKYNGDEWVNNTVMISAKRACSGTIKNVNSSWAGFEFTVDANGITTLTIPERYAYNENNEEFPDDKSLVLTATDTVSVYICNIATFSFDASFVLPVESLGSEYIIQSDQQSKSASYSFQSQETSCFVIIAIEDNTEVDITPSVATLNCEPGVTQTVTLNRGGTYMVRSNNTEEWRDLSGSSVFARNGKKIAVFNGNTLTCIPSSVGNGMDHIFEQALPVDSWGRQFALTTSASRARDLVKITSASDGNEVMRNGNHLVTLNYGESYDFSLYSSEGSCFIETSEPSMVYLYNTTGQEPNEPVGSNNGDPSMVWIPPVEQRIKDITFCTFDHVDATIDYHYVNVVVENKDVGGVFLDGVNINPNEFHPVRGTDENSDDGFSFVRKSINHGTHHLSCESGLIAHVYGFGEAKGYAYCVGANVINLNTKLYVNEKWSEFYRDGLFMCHDETVDFRVSTNYPIDRVNWDFDDGLSGTGQEITHGFEHGGDYLVTAYIRGINAFSQQYVYDTMTMDIHVGEHEIHVCDTMVCGLDAFDYYGVEYTQSGHYERIGTSIYGCDSTYILTLDMEFVPYFDFVGTHWPIGGSETHISVNEYAIQLDNNHTKVDTVLWQIDCPNWYVVPHGDKGKKCTLYIFSYLLEPVMLHATAINRCDTIEEEFFIQTSYYGVEDGFDNEVFTISPNPSDGQITMHFGDLTGRIEIEVYNVMGQKVDTFSVDANLRKEITYLMPNLKNGLYYFVMNTNGTRFTQKVMLVR